MKRIALVFDLDGTLVDSMPDLRAALNVMLAEVRRRELTPDEVRYMIGDGTRALVERALAATGTVTDFEAAHQRFLRLYEAAPAKLSRLYPGVEITLESLRASGARLAICTNKPQTATLRVLEAFGIATSFDAVLGGDAVPFRKPDPRAAGTPIILMRYGYLRVPPESLAPDVWLDRFADIPRTVANCL
jgi:phosphoglycolate phosphatase